MSEVADPYTSIIEGRSYGMPTGSSDFVDDIHPNNGGAIKVKNVAVAGII